MDLTRRVRDKMMKERLMFVYRGIVTNENSVPLLMLLEKEMENSEFGITGRKRLFMFVLESLQNVSRHSDQRQQHSNMSIVLYSKTETGYTVTTGNVLPSSQIADLKDKLEEINHLEPDEIRKVYREMLAKSDFNDKGGAGLGLIEMAKKTGNKLDYDFVTIDDMFSYFILSKTVNSMGVGMHSKEEKTFGCNPVSQIERLMAENNVYLIWSGHVSDGVNKEVLSFTETKLTEEDVALNLRRRVFGILVEILENLARYSPGKEPEKMYGMPVAMIRMEEGIYSITTGNLIHNDYVELLKAKLDIINENDKVGLKEMFRTSISVQTIETESTGNLGLIDMARKSGSKLQYQFERLNCQYSYYTLTVKVDDQY